jgi:ADP-ribose pyrophosphatase YjhB (NUDIX family)
MELNNNNNNKDFSFKILHQKELYSRYLSLYDRKIEFPNGIQVDYDIIGHKFNTTGYFVCVFPFDSKKKTTTIIKEFCQASNSMKYSLPCGHFDIKHHRDFKHAAECELSEEANLKSNYWIPLLPEGHNGILEVKWCVNKFIPFLAMDYQTDPNPMPKDKEEYIITINDLNINQLKEIILNGEMLLHSVQTSFMAINYLEKNHYL